MFGRAWLTQSLALKLAVAGGLSLAVVALAPHTVDRRGGVPPVSMLLVTATLIAAISCGLLFWGLRSDLGLPVKAAIYAAAFNAIVVVVKLALAPRGFYDVNQRRDIDATFGTIDNWFVASLAAAFIFGLYLIVYVVLYRTFRGKLAAGAETPRAFPRLPRPRNIVLSVVVLTVLLVASGGALLIALLPILGGLDYLDFVFSSGLSLVIAVLLACATSLAALAFNSAADRARVVGDVSVFLSFFWVGLYFLALYHVLWVVYVLVLTSIWPLKVVTPK